MNPASLYTLSFPNVTRFSLSHVSSCLLRPSSIILLQFLYYPIISFLVFFFFFLVFIFLSLFPLFTFRHQVNIHSTLSNLARKALSLLIFYSNSRSISCIRIVPTCTTVLSLLSAFIKNHSYMIILSSPSLFTTVPAFIDFMPSSTKQ